MLRKLPILAAGLLLAVAACRPASFDEVTAARSSTGPDSATEVSAASAPTTANQSVAGIEARPDASGALTEAGIAAPAPSGKNLQPQLQNADIDLNEVIALLPPDAIRAIAVEEVAQILVTAAEAEATGLPPDVRVIGLEVNGESQAYPIPFLSRHEIVNVDIGGRHLAVTW